MDVHSNNTHDSDNSSPRSRDTDHQDLPSYKVKVLCSHGGRIQPRPYDNLLSYYGGETKIVSFDRNVSFSAMKAKLLSLCNLPDIIYKYQLPGEDLDALISITDEEDLEHLMSEYDRLQRSYGKKPVRLRLFLFPNYQSPISVCTVKNPDFLFGLDDNAQTAPEKPGDMSKDQENKDFIEGKSGELALELQTLQVTEREEGEPVSKNRHSDAKPVVSGYGFPPPPVHTGFPPVHTGFPVQRGFASGYYPVYMGENGYSYSVGGFGEPILRPVQPVPEVGFKPVLYVGPTVGEPLGQIPEATVEFQRSPTPEMKAEKPPLPV
ncbi:uncharacterized protein LOC18426661 [Amborella trichopoda]|uniref:PB1 domain-containing protein n=1 Tax=Amborella trichopoda TaxID=13333 RepID=W1NVE4_AMBTC|nr:uncharacterized protein LOC18426661 [Amborella trichopoda]ERM98644.1 hypothetical protein AMTR_s00109p00100750 [Amborella trichopoda]|eukprot:XP_006833366.1 uncharacterized protein LOC18426661 [Amborella trichopoda]